MTITTTPFTTGQEGTWLDVPAETYHAAPGVSNSMLKHLNPPARLPVYLTEKREPSVAMVIGTITHQLQLEPDKPLPQIALRDEESGDDRFNFRTKVGKAWRDEQAAKGIPILKVEEFEAVKRMAAAINNHPLCRAIFADGFSEVSCFKRDYDTEILRKARLDYVPIGGNSLADIKTTTDEGASEKEFSKTLYDLRYFVQAAYYLDLWNDLHPDDKREHFTFVAVEKKPPYLVAVYFPGRNEMDAGREVYQRDLWTYRKCAREKFWPGYGEAATEIHIPHWAVKELADIRGRELQKYGAAET